MLILYHMQLLRHRPGNHLYSAIIAKMAFFKALRKILRFVYIRLLPSPRAEVASKATASTTAPVFTDHRLPPNIERVDAEPESAFLALPAELRIHIYELALPNDQVFVIAPWSPRMHRLQPSITKANKQIRNESLPIYDSISNRRILAMAVAWYSFKVPASVIPPLGHREWFTFPDVGYYMASVEPGSHPDARGQFRHEVERELFLVYVFRKRRGLNGRLNKENLDELVKLLRL